MFVSVLICFHNDEKYIKKSVESILNQSYRNFELVLIDDFSTDSSSEIVRNIADINKNKVRCYKNKENYGLTKSLNIGLDICKGDIIVRSDADDYSNINRLETIVDEFTNNPEVEFVFSCVNHIDENGVFIKKSRYINKTLSFYLLKHFNVFTHGSSAFKSYNKFRYDEEIKFSQDYALWLKEIKKNNFRVINNPLYNLRIHKRSISNKKKIQQILCAVYAQNKYRFASESNFDHIKKKLIQDKKIKKLFFYQLLIRGEKKLFKKYNNGFDLCYKLIFTLINQFRK